MTKKCSKCQKIKELSEFYKDRQKSDGFTSKCKICINSEERIYTKNHRTEVSARQKRYQQKESYKEYKREYRKKYNAKRLPERAAQVKQKRHTDINFKLRDRLRVRLNSAIKRGQKAGSAVKDLGCSIEELKAHISSLFQPGMTWENHGAWHIDHRIPLASFDLSKREDFVKACHYTNLQPLWAIDNLKKGDRIK